MRSLRAKLLVLLGLPVAALVLLAGVGFRSSQDRIDRARDQVAVTELSSATDLAVRALVVERRAAADPDVSGDGPISGRTDDALDLLDQQLTDHPGHQSGQEAEAVRAAIDGITTVRGDLDSEDRATEVHTAYDTVIDPILALRGDTTSLTPDTLRRLEAQRGLVHVADQLDREDGLIRDAAARGLMEHDTYLALADAASAMAVWDGQVMRTAPAAQAEAYEQSLATTLGPPDEGVPALLLDAGPAVEVDDTVVDGWTTEVDEVLDHLGTLTGDGEEELGEIAQDRLDAAARAQLVALGWLAAALLGVVVLLVLLWRLVLAPLRASAAEARKAEEAITDAVATGDLSDVNLITPRKDATELIGITRSVGRLQLTSAALIKERAETTTAGQDVHLAFGKRAQDLVNRQLNLIDGLEARTEDPEVLSELFALDHLTTRLRRTAESMVLLAGAESARPWARPISAVNMIRAAMAETIDYSRVNLAHVDPGAVTGAVANDVAHLLAELIDNGLTHAPPESRVTATGERRPDGSYLIGISNVGQGLPPDELSRANTLLRGARPETDDTAPLPFSLHVAGRLAALHGIEVTLNAAPLGRIRAEVTLPRPIMVLPTDADAPALSPAARPATPATN